MHPFHTYTSYTLSYLPRVADPSSPTPIHLLRVSLNITQDQILRLYATLDLIHDSIKAIIPLCHGSLFPHLLSLTCERLEHIIFCFSLSASLGPGKSLVHIGAKKYLMDYELSSLIFLSKLPNG